MFLIFYFWGFLDSFPASSLCLHRILLKFKERILNFFLPVAQGMNVPDETKRSLSSMSGCKGTGIPLGSAGLAQVSSGSGVRKGLSPRRGASAHSDLGSGRDGH